MFLSETSDITSGSSRRVIISPSWWCPAASVRVCSSGTAWCRGDLVPWLATGAGYHWCGLRSSWVIHSTYLLTLKVKDIWVLYASSVWMDWWSSKVHVASTQVKQACTYDPLGQYEFSRDNSHHLLLYYSFSWFHMKYDKSVCIFPSSGHCTGSDVNCQSENVLLRSVIAVFGVNYHLPYWFRKISGGIGGLQYMEANVRCVKCLLYFFAGKT